MNKLAILSCSLACLLCGCDDTLQARYDTMTGKKCSKPSPMYLCAQGDGHGVYRTYIDGHLYFVLGSVRVYNTGSIIHAESCPCKTSAIQNIHN